ncbi:hypothetical protein EOD40_05455 [Flavobacterium sufflavum]|uniref:Uncharacterized protein n=1 Tax=Flavobacterium sufflavum TaxID=1921138 RepID=A0A3S2U5A2_9FLAO|nr:hypothetical protein [Flavobacterium sufflavum]RVT78681.1 hypothetical protein EOD40_05455 [Flavobacterium sufflavum]
MEPNKLEKQFREQLNSREIKPSEMAWTKLDTMLSAAEKPKAKFPWLYVAASLAGLLLIGTAYFAFQEKTIKTQKNEVVIQKTVAPKTKAITSDSVNLKMEKKESIVQIIQKSTSKSNQPSELKQESVAVRNEVSVINQNKDYDSVAVSFEKKNFQSMTKNKYVSAEKLLAEISNTKFESANETMGSTTKTISVNPQILLSNAENELNQSFKESALDRFNKKIKTIKTVLANRNYED